MPTYEEVQERIRTRPRTWLVTGVAAIIGSSVLEFRLKRNQQVVGLDNLSTASHPPPGKTNRLSSAGCAHLPA